ncbi:hypothetical protein RLIN73S_03840 [Rhodanobacter lindaniclasticus]
MRCVLVLCTALLAACGEQPVGHLADALAADPVRLKALREQCTAHPRQVMQATGEERLPRRRRSLPAALLLRPGSAG